MTRFLTLAQAAERVDRSQSTVRRWIDEGLTLCAGMIREDELIEFEQKVRSRRGRPRKTPAEVIEQLWRKHADALAPHPVSAEEWFEAELRGRIYEAGFRAGAAAGITA